MEWSIMFAFNSVLLGVGLAMDAFSVSMANGLNDTKMKKGRMCNCRRVCRISVCDACYWVDLCSYSDSIFHCVWEVHSVDCSYPSCIYRRKNVV